MPEQNVTRSGGAANPGQPASGDNVEEYINRIKAGTLKPAEYAALPQAVRAKLQATIARRGR